MFGKSNLYRVLQINVNTACLKLRFILCLLASGNFCYTQEFFFKNYSIEQGLVQSQVNDIIQDKSGFLWISTNGGVSRFDGKNFVNYSVFNGLADQQVNRLISLDNGTIYAGTLGSLCEFTGDTFVQHRLPSTHAGSYVVDLFLLDARKLLVSTDLEGLFEYDTQTKIFSLVPGTASIDLIRNVYKDSQNRYWICSKSGLFFKSDNGDWLKVQGARWEGVQPSDIIEAKSGEFWVSTYGQGLICFTSSDTVQYLSEGHVVSDSFRKLFKTSKNQIYCLSKSGMTIIDNHKFSSITSKQGMSHVSTECIFEDQEGNLWIGTDGRGLLKFIGREILIYTQKSGLCSDLVMSFQEYRGDLMIGTYDRGLCSMNRSIMPIKLLASETIWDMHVDAREHVWVSSTNHVLRIQGDKVVEKFKIRRVNALAEDEQGNIWLAYRKGLLKYSTANHRLDSFHTVGQRIRGIASGHHCLWAVGTKGLIKITPHQLIIIPLPKQAHVIDLTSVLEVNDKVYIGTSQGIFIYHIDSKTFDRLLFSSSPGANSIHAMVKDQEGDIWCGTNFGIFCVKGSTNQLLHFDTEDGLPSLECNQNAAYADNEGFLWFGTAAGVCKIDPLIVKKRKMSSIPRLNLLGVRLFMQPMKHKKSHEMFLGESMKSFKLPFDKNHLTFDFIGVYLQNPSNVYYRHRLSGFEKEFSWPHQNTYVTYSNISPGKYSFEVEASLDLIHWSKPKKVPFIIMPPFYFRIWFIAGLTLFVFFIFYLVYRVRNSLRKKKVEAQQLQYQTRLLELEQQALNASMNRHFVFNSLNSIQYFINVEDKKSANTYLTKFAKLIRKNLDDLQSDCVPLEEEIERIKLYLSLEEMRFEGSFKYVVDLDQELVLMSVAIPTMIIQPFVENSILHGILPQDKPGFVSIHISKKEDTVVFIIQDNGVGYDTSIEQKNTLKNTHASKGMSITKERLSVLKKVYSNDHIGVLGPMELKDPEGKSIGTSVEIRLPYFLMKQKS